MKNLITFIVLVFLFNPSSLFAEAEETLEPRCIEGITESECTGDGQCWQGGCCWDTSCSEGSIVVTGQAEEDTTHTYHTRPTSATSGSSQGSGGGGGSGTTGTPPVTEAQADTYEASINRECLYAVEYDDTNGGGRIPSLGRYEADAVDVEACEDYAECMRNAYIATRYIGSRDQATCANTTLCEAEYNWYNVTVNNVATATQTLSGSIIESSLGMVGKGVYSAQANATESYCDCMTHFGVQKTTSICN